jgi:hypothetical protein
VSPRLIACVVAVVLVAVGHAAAATRSSQFARTVSCRSGEVRITYDGESIVVRSGNAVLGRASRTTRSVARACTRIHKRSAARNTLDRDFLAGRRVTLVCRRGSPTVIEVQPTRNDSGRVVGSRLAIWQAGVLGEVAEGVVAPRRSWFSWSSLSCRPG